MCVLVLSFPVFDLQITHHPHFTDFFVMDVKHNPQAFGGDVLYNGVRLEKHVTGNLDYRLSRFYAVFFRFDANQVFRDVLVVLSRCFYNYKASFVIVTIYKVRESGVEKKIGFHFSLKQIRKFFLLALSVWLPFDLAARGALLSIVNAEGVVISNDHEFHGVLTENHLVSPVHLSL